MAAGAVARVVAKVPKVGRVAATAITGLIAAVKIGESQLKEINRRAREKHDYVTATLTQFKLDLDQGEADSLLIRSK